MRRAFLAGVTFLSASAIAASPAYGASLTLRLSPTSPQYGQTVSLFESGYTEDSSAMWTYYEVGASSCASTAGNEAARPSSYSIDLRFPDPGNFSYTGQFVADSYGTYRICGYLSYLDDSDQAAPRATAQATFSIPEPRAPTVTISPGYGPKVGEPLRITHYVHVGVPAKLSAYVEVPDPFSCAATSFDELLRDNSRLIATHDVTRYTTIFTDSYTPQVPGRHLLCSYVEESESPYRAVADSAVVTVPQPAPPRLYVSSKRRNVKLGKKLAVSVYAESPVAGRVTLYSDTPRKCAVSASRENARRASRLESDRAIAKGGTADYTKRVRFRSAGTRHLCGYITELGTAKTVARDSWLVTVRR